MGKNIKFIDYTNFINKYKKTYKYVTHSKDVSYKLHSYYGGNNS